MNGFIDIRGKIKKEHRFLQLKMFDINYCGFSLGALFALNRLYAM